MNLTNKSNKELQDILDKIDDDIINLEEIYDNDVKGLKRDKQYIYQEFMRREKEI